MLQSIRDRATGWIAWIIVGLLIIPFALWGVHEYFGGGSAINVAKVNKVDISRIDLNAQVDLELRAKKQRPEGAALQAFRRDVLNRMIREELLFQSARAHGFRIHEAAIVEKIRSNTAFQVDGKFDQKRYEELLRYNGLSPDSYQARLAREILIEQYLGAVLNSAFVTPDELQTLLELQDRKIDLAYLTLPQAEYEKQVSVSDEEIAKHFEENPDAYMTPERVRVDYLKLDLQTIADSLGFTEEQLRNYYEENKNNFLMPEQRKVAHILVRIPENAGDDAIKQASDKAQKIYGELQSGASFSDLAKKYSDDAGSADQGGEIGVLEKGSVDPAFEEAAGKLKVGEYSKPVKTSFGFHIIKVLEIKPGVSKTFEQARDEVDKLYRRQQAENLFFDRSEKLYNLTYENPGTLDVAARELGLKIQKSDWFTKAGEAKGLASNPKLVEAAFSGEVFAGGDVQRSLNSKPIEIKDPEHPRDQSVVVIRLADYVPRQARKLEEVKDRIRATLLRQKATENMKKDAETYLQKLRAGEDMAKLAEQKKLDYKAVGFVGRVDQKLDGEMLAAAFRLPKPVDNKPSFGSLQTAKGDVVIFTVRAIQEGKPGKENDPTRKFLAQFMQNMQANIEIEAFVNSLKSQADVKIFEDALRQENEA